MSSIANIVAFDGAATPVSHTLLPESVARDGNVITASYKESAASVPDIAQVRATIKRTKLQSGVSKVVTRVEVPVMESVSGQNSSGYTAAPKVAFVDTVEVIGYFHERSTPTSRRLARQLCMNIVGNISTSVAAATAGPVPEAFDLSVMPT